MADALAAGYDLVGIAACYVAIALLALTAYLVDQLANDIDVSIAGFHPFAGVATWLHNDILGAVNSALRGVERTAAAFESGLIDAFGMFIAIPALLFLGVKAALEYLWLHALRPLIHSITDTIRETADKALAVGQLAERDAAAALEKARAYADGVAARTLSSAESFATREAATARSAAEGYADTAVAKLRAAEDAAVANVTGLVREAEAEAKAAAALATSDLAAAEEYARTFADSVGAQAWRGIDDLSATVGKDFEELVGSLGIAGAAGLIASIPLLATLVQTIAAESGLDNPECRSKVKGVCRTDPLAWANLLASIGIVGFSFSLRDIYALARPLVSEGAAVIRKAA